MALKQKGDETSAEAKKRRRVGFANIGNSPGGDTGVEASETFGLSAASTGGDVEMLDIIHTKVCNFDTSPPSYWYANLPLSGGTAKKGLSVVDFDCRWPIEGEIDRRNFGCRRSIEGEKGKKKKRKRRKKKRRTYFPRAVLARAPSPPSPAGAFSPPQGNKTSPHAGRKIEVTSPL
ncbi:hypothetical protein B296_00048277 [Ensete ventricosum]|uniref:Uncharacterized protein n=1 Tax=Ensete ventricosum TaxID=4639 RepID=A0A426YVB6_ENSVE|nr:hypothetical protein B296_00048277 [Ensete ventricosum]